MNKEGDVVKRFVDVFDGFLRFDVRLHGGDSWWVQDGCILRFGNNFFNDKLPSLKIRIIEEKISDSGGTIESDGTMPKVGACYVEELDASVEQRIQVRTYPLYSRTHIGSKAPSDQTAAFRIVLWMRN